MAHRRRCSILSFMFALVVLAACGDETGVPKSPELFPVEDDDAPTVKELLAGGLMIVEMVEVGCGGARDFQCDGFSDLYLGQDRGPDQPGLITFACPGSEKPSGEWKCRKLSGPRPAR
jgi:hypothetical protein